MKIRNKNNNSVYEIIEENDDIENLTEGSKYHRIWKYGEFKLYEVPFVENDGSIVLPKDTVLILSEETDNNININNNDKGKWDKFWKNHSVTEYVIRGGFEILDDKNE